MFESVEINHFRCFSHASVRNLGHVNLITGRNNAGKTALLEAIWLLHARTDPAELYLINGQRGIEPVDLDAVQSLEPPWDTFFHNFDTSLPVRVVGLSRSSQRHQTTMRVVKDVRELSEDAAALTGLARDLRQRRSTVPMTPRILQTSYEGPDAASQAIQVWDQRGLNTTGVPEPPEFPTLLIPARLQLGWQELADNFGRLQVRDGEGVVLDALRLLEPRLTKISVVSVRGQPLLHGRIGEQRLIPLALMGEGMVRVAYLAIWIACAEDGALLVDEIENGLHHSLLEPIWRVIGSAARHFRAQVFATTHSAECVVAAEQGLRNAVDLRVHRLERRGGQVEALTYDPDTLRTAIQEGFEVR